MSLKKAMASGKERRRKLIHGKKKWCGDHGCEYCLNGRMHKTTKKLHAAEEQIEELDVCQKD